MLSTRVAVLASLFAASTGNHTYYYPGSYEVGSGTYSYDSGSGSLSFECFSAMFGLQTACGIPDSEPTETEEKMAVCASWRECTDYRDKATKACESLGDANPVADLTRMVEDLCSTLSPTPPPPAPPPMHPPPATMRLLPLVIALSLAGTACLLSAIVVGVSARRREA